MELLEELQSLYTGYLLKTQQLERDRKPADGLLGMGSGPAADPCHDRFAQELEALLHRMDSLPSSQLFQALSFIYTAPFAHRGNPSAYWMLQAVHGLTVPLIPRLSPEDAQALRTQYQEDYPRWERLPAQKQVLAALKRNR